MGKGIIQAAIRSGTRKSGQDVVDLVIVSGSLGVQSLTGTTKPVINNQATTFADLAAVTTAYNALLAALRTRGVIGGS
jgi:hypothetical protein